MNKTHVSWELFRKLTDELAKQIRHDNEGSRAFDIILAPACGGWIPARILKSKLGVPELISVRVYRWMGGDLTMNLLPVDLTDKRILIVDDIADSGETLAAILAYLDMNYKEKADVKVATLYRRAQSIVRPHYFMLESDAWVVFPWEEGENAIRDRDIHE